MSTQLVVTRTEEITPSLRRVWFRSDDLSAFADSVFTDRYVKLVFPPPAPEDKPVVRTYTALFPDVVDGTVAIDFVIHGDTGVAGPWAARAVVGDRLEANGPGGAYRPDVSADWHLLIGDEAALPAITAALAAMPADAVVRVVALVEDARHRPDLPTNPGTDVHWLHRAEGDTSLLDAVRALDWLPGQVQVFAHGEAGEIMHGVRPYLFTERAVPRDQASVSGYWRRGRTEEGFRDWKAELAAAERAGA